MDFEKTLQNNARFSTYTMGIITLLKSIEVIQKRGADEKAVSFLLAGVEILIQQLGDKSQELENKEFVEEFLKKIQKEKKSFGG